MSILDWLDKKKKKSNPISQRLDIPGDLWVKCFSCATTLYLKELEQQQKVCSNCGYHFRITPNERLQQICDPNTFIEKERDIKPIDFLNFEDTEQYKKRLEKAAKKSTSSEAIIVGEATIKKRPINIGIMDFSFMGGSMGSVVGEKITRLIETALINKYPLIIVTSSGGARMQEGIMSLMQMAKTSGCLYKLAQQNIPYISILCDPTTGGTSASFAMLGDINIGEPGALISFAGPRVIEQTVREKLPKGFQRAEFLLDHGMLDLVIHRKDLKETLHQLITTLDPRENA